MSSKVPRDVRNVALVAHVDHGKTTLVDSMLWQSPRLFDARDVGPGSSIDPALDREKIVNVMARVTSLSFRDTRINIVDTPGRADFAGEVERVFTMVEGILILVDACEGPAPQTRLVLQKALETGLAPLVVLNKIDRPEARIDETLDEIRRLFDDLDATDEQKSFPVFYTNALRGVCRREPDGPDESLLPLFEGILSSVPAPETDANGGVQFQVTMLDYDDFLGRLALGRVFRGTLRRGQDVTHCRHDGRMDPLTIQGLFGYEGLRRVAIEEAGPGEIVTVSAVDGVVLGDTLCDRDAPSPLPRLRVDRPSIVLELAVNDSPMAGLEGRYVSSASLRERLWRELLTNVAIEVEETDLPNSFRLYGRDELQLAILVEMMRREGFEFQLGGPRVPLRDEAGKRLEPFELLIVDCPAPPSGVVKEKLAARKGRLTRMVDHGNGRVRMEFRIPSRGLIGFRSEFLSDTRGAGILNHVFDGYDVWQGDRARRSTGALIADRPGRATAHAIEHLQPRGTMFVAPGDQVYEGMIVGEHLRPDDSRVQVTKARRPGASATPRSEEPTRLIPPRSMSLEQALEFVRDDELVEVTPRAIRLRKKNLQYRDGD